MKFLRTRRLRAIDAWLLVPLLFLMVVGLTIIYSIGLNRVSPNTSVFYKQLVFAVAGLAVIFFLTGTNYRLWSAYYKLVYVGCALLLVAVLVFGTTIRNTTGWISLGGFSFQPVELAKVGLIVFLARYFSDHGRLFFLWRHIVVSGIATAVFVGLVLLQPDLGSAIVLGALWFCMILGAGIPRGKVFILVGTACAVMIIAWLFVLAPYQKERIFSFVNPQADPQGIGYNVRQSIIAIGSGRILGRGFALGSQSQLRFLPEPETDFIFAVIAEEFGYVGVVLVLAAFFILLYRMLGVARRTQDNFAAYLCFGAAALVAVQSFINIGMNLGIAPVTGIPLPLLSAGGSSLLTTCLLLGIIASIVSDERTLPKGVTG